ncbi:MAG TPA: TonB family protein [Steroidobacteraceae bacterium]
MRGWRRVTFRCTLVLAAYPQLMTAQSGAAVPAGELRTAHFAWGSDPAKRCPELRQTNAEEGAVAVLAFLVGSTGVPSKVSVRESSGSESFDAAASGCVLKLRFLAATRLGDAVPIESWQQLALKSAAPASAPQAARCDEAGTGPNGTANSAVVADAQEANDRKQPGPTMARAGVCVCVDQNGKPTQPPVLTSSSGIPGFDKAALELSGAARYRPAAASNGQPTPGCFRFKVGIDVK